MAKLSEEVLEQGRECVRQQNLDGLTTWLDTHAAGSVNRNVFLNTFRSVFTVGDVPKGLKFFNATFEEYDRTVDLAIFWVKAGCVIFVLVGALGGFVYLLRTIF